MLQGKFIFLAEDCQFGALKSHLRKAMMAWEDVPEEH